jgi:hypothetical protein
MFKRIANWSGDRLLSAEGVRSASAATWSRYAFYCHRLGDLFPVPLTVTTWVYLAWPSTMRT